MIRSCVARLPASHRFGTRPGKIMVALIHNHSFGLKLWRVLGVVLMLTQSGCDVKDNRIKKRRLRARRECVKHQFIAEADGFRCEALTKRGAVRRPWRRTFRPDKPHNSCGRLPDVIWWFLDILVHLVTYRRRNGKRESLAHEYLHSWWFVIDALFIFPALAKRFMSTIAPTLKRLTGLDHLYQFLWKHLIRNGAVRDKWCGPRGGRSVTEDILDSSSARYLLAMDAVYYLERLVEIAEQTYEVVRRRTILDRSEAAAVKRRIRAKLRVAAMMKKMSLPEASAAPAVVTPSTPSAAPSAAKGVFARAVTVDEQSDSPSSRLERLGYLPTRTKNSIREITHTTYRLRRDLRGCARVRERNGPVLSQHERARDRTLRSLNPVAAPRSILSRGGPWQWDAFRRRKGRRIPPHYMRPCAMSTRMPCCPSRISRRNEATAIQTTGLMSTPNDGGTMSRVILSSPSVGAQTSTQGISFTSVSGNQLMMTRSSMMNWMRKKHGSSTFDTGSTQAGPAA